MRLHEVVDSVTAEGPPMRFTVDDIVGAGRRAQRRRRVGFASVGVAGLAVVAAAGILVLPSPGARQPGPVMPAASATNAAVLPAPALSSVAVPPPPTGSASASLTPSDIVSSGAAATLLSAGTHTVLLDSYDVAKHTAVVEPVTLGSGAQFCTAHHVASDKCSSIGTTIAPSGKKYTLAVDTGVRVFSTKGGDPTCMGKAKDAFTIPGSCLAGGSDYLHNQVVASKLDGWLAQITFTNNSIRDVAELYQS
jgi:hypothetical protein